MTSREFFTNVNKKDVKGLISWWNANTPFYHFKQKNSTGKLYTIFRQELNIDL